MLALRTVFSRPGNSVLGATAFALMATFYGWSSQILIFSDHGIRWLWQPLFGTAALLMAGLFAVLLPLEVHAFRLAATSSLQAGGTVGSALLGTASMTCCAPVLLPSVLSLLGLSGTSILSINGLLNRFWLPLATLSTLLLLYALVSVIRSLDVRCRLPDRAASTDGPVESRPGRAGSP